MKNWEIEMFSPSGGLNSIFSVERNGRTVSYPQIISTR